VTDDPAALSNLRDLALPPSVPWWPPQLGWWVIGAGVLALASLGVVSLLRHHRANAYRREALRALPDTPIPALAELLKRTALAAYPRTMVAGLTGQDWLAFLQRTAGFPPAAGVSLTRIALDPSKRVDLDEARGLRSAVTHWIRHHRAAR
jgi:hypothetical protein